MSTSVQSNTSTSSDILSPFDLKKRYSDREVAQLQTLLYGIKQKIQQVRLYLVLGSEVKVHNLCEKPSVSIKNNI
jgi:hypothetical protein